MIEGTCHCGAAHWCFEGIPESATACNCTVCRRYGVLWIYGHEGHEISVTGETRAYERGREHISFNFCPRCGCIVSWRANGTGRDGRRRIAVNIRLAEPDTVAHLPIDHFDGLNTFEDLPRDGKRVADYCF